MQYCKEKAGAYADYPFGPAPLVMKVEGKIFALFAQDDLGIGNVSLKCDPQVAANLREQHDAVRPGYHLNKQHWNTVTLDGSLEEADVQAMISHSYELVVAGLPKAKRAALITGADVRGR